MRQLSPYKLEVSLRLRDGDWPHIEEQVRSSLEAIIREHQGEVPVITFTPDEQQQDNRCP